MIMKQLDTMAGIGKCLINVHYYYFYQNHERLYKSHINFKINKMYLKYVQLFYFLSFLPVQCLILHAPPPHHHHHHHHPACGVGTLQGTLLPNWGLRLGNVGEQMEHWVSINTFATVCLSKHHRFLSLRPSFYTWIPFQPSSQGKPEGPASWQPHQSPLSVRDS